MTIHIRSAWQSDGGYRGRYVPVAPAGWLVLADSAVVNDAGAQCRDIIAAWLRSRHIHYRSGYLRTSNVFSATMYVVAESDSVLTPELVNAIDNWFTTWVTSTFSIFSGEETDLDISAARAAFDLVTS